MFRKWWIAGLLIAWWSGSPLAVSGEESLAERRERVESMSAEEKMELLRKQESFVRLPDEEQARLRQLHEQIEQSETPERLQTVLERYHAWLATLSSAEKAELYSLPVEKRVAHIRDLMQKQEDERFKKEVSDKLTREDREAIMKWLGVFIEAHKTEISEAIPPERRPRDLDRWPLLFFVLAGWADANSNMPRPQIEEVEALIAELSPPAQETFRSVRDPQKKMETAQKWIRAAVTSRRWSAPPRASTEELRTFYVEKLTPSERERLEALPREEMQQALQRLYNENYFRGRGGPPRSGRPPSPGSQRGGREGDDRRPDRGKGGSSRNED